MWNFLNNNLENSHCSQEQAEECLRGNYSDGNASVLLKLIPTLEASCLPAKETDALTDSQYGTMSAVSLGGLGEVRLTSLQEDSRALMSVILDQEARGSALKEKEADSGAKWQESSKKLGLPSSSSRTLLKSDIGALKPSFKTLPKWGSIVHGTFSPQRSSEHHMRENVSGVWLGTPTAHMHVRSKRFKAKTPNLSEVVGGRQNANPEYLEWQMGWPIGWSDSFASAMDKFQSWRVMLLRNCKNKSKED